jgi:exopolyphosphatase/guanosine-5'-triphosphate,3'-diphosphate pyrophosphatase
MARLYGYEEAHTAHVAHLATGLFDQLIPVHGYGEKERDYLWAASLLHDIGTVIDYYDHHKHSAYMILNAGLPGYSHREIILIALLCMYHRKGAPTVAPYSGILDKKDRLMVSRLAALLRLAEYLDRSRAQTVADVEISIRDGAALLLVHARNPGDAAVEIWEAGQRGDLFEQAYGLMLEIEAA